LALKFADLKRSAEKGNNAAEEAKNPAEKLFSALADRARSGQAQDALLCCPPVRLGWQPEYSRLRCPIPNCDPIINSDGISGSLPQREVCCESYATTRAR
jgi:hypothetical protein